MERPNKEEKLHQYSNKSNPKTIKKCRSLPDLRTPVKSIHLLNNSPQNLMFSLPNIGFRKWKVWNNDLAVEEILRDKKEAILKGKRLFEDTDEIGFDYWDKNGPICSYDYDNDNIKNIENKSVSRSPLPSLSSSVSYVCDECMEKQIVGVEEEKEVFVGGLKGSCWFGIGLSVCVIGVITVWRCCSYGDRDEVMFLVPT